MSIRIQEQVLFEISMAIGNSLDLEKMLCTAMITYLRKLCCMGGAVLLKADSDDSYHIAFNYPRMGAEKEAARYFLKMVNSEDPEFDANDFPLHINMEGNHYYLQELPGAGFLMIEKGLSPLSRSMLNSLKLLNAKLASSILSCKAHHSNKVLNEDLKKLIKDRHDVEQELLAERRKYQVIFDNSPIGIVYYDSHGIIKDCNRKFAEIIGVERSNLIGINSFEQGNEESREIFNRAFKGEYVTYEGFYPSRNRGSKVYLRANLNPVFSDGKLTEVVTTIEELDPPKKG